MKPSGVAVAMLIVSAGSGAAAAQASDSPRLGLTIGTPRNVGVVWHLGSVAIRPDLAISHSSSDAANGAETSSASWTIGLAGVLYLSKQENVNLFVSPRVAYSSSASESGATRLESSGLEYSASFGAEHVATPRLHLWGETGYSFVVSTANKAISAESRTRVGSVRSVLGVSVFFGSTP